MKLTMNIVGDTTIETIGSINLIPLSSPIPTPNIQTFRGDSVVRYLTVWDVTTDMIPRVTTNASLKIKINEWGTYTNGIFVPESGTTPIYDNVTSSYVPTGQIINISDLGYNLDSSSRYHFNSLFDILGAAKLIYIKFSYSNDVLTNHYLFPYATQRPAFNVGMQNEKSAPAPAGTIVPITMGMFDNFDYLKQLTQTEIEQRLGVDIYNDLTNYYGEPTLDKYLKIYLLDNNLSSSYPGFVKIPRLTLFGEDVYYGQAISWKDIQNGGLLLNTIGLNKNTVYNLNIGVEGFISGRIYLRMV